jgi:hypothetical protein
VSPTQFVLNHLKKHSILGFWRNKPMIKTKTPCPKRGGHLRKDTHSAQLAAERQWGIGHTLLASLRGCILACAVPLYDFGKLKLDLANEMIGTKEDW